MRGRRSPQKWEISRRLSTAIEHCVHPVDPKPRERILDLATGIVPLWRDFFCYALASAAFAFSKRCIFFSTS